MSAALEIARVNLVRTLRERTSLFFVFLLPLILIVGLGTVYGGSGTARLGIALGADTPLAEELAGALEEGELAVDLRRRDSLESLRAGVEAGELSAGLYVPADYDEALRTGASAELVLVARAAELRSSLRQAVEAAAARQSARVRAARLAQEHADVDFEAALQQARAVQSALPGLDIELTSAGSALFAVQAGAFAFGAQSQVILFMFLTSLTAATQLILTRQLGVSRRMLATPTPIRSILAGELLGRFAVAMLQGVFIVLASTLLFGVAWGDLLGASVVIVLFALIGTGLAMVVGSLSSNPDQASALGVVLGMLLGALGGAMVPAELFTEPLSTISRLTPHAWAIDALRDVAFRGAGIIEILLQVAVLAAMAAVLVGAGVWSLRRALTRP